MLTLDRSLPAIAVFSASSSLARLSWLNATEPLRAIGPAAGAELLLLLEPSAFFEQPAVNASIAIADSTTTGRKLVRIIALSPSDLRDGAGRRSQASRNPGR